MRMTEEEYISFMARRAGKARSPIAPGRPPALAVSGELREDPAPRYRSKTEARYAELLEYQKRIGEIIVWRYEPMRLTLAQRTTFLVDFLVIYETRPRELQLHEVKGSWIRSAGMVKLKVAAALWPYFTFVLCQWTKGQWHYREIPR